MVESNQTNFTRVEMTQVATGTHVVCIIMCSLSSLVGHVILGTNEASQTV